MNTMGLVCDPVDGLVEIPCVYRNASGAAQALCAAQMALAGLVCPIACDDLIARHEGRGRAHAAIPTRNRRRRLRGVRVQAAGWLKNGNPRRMIR